RLAEEVRLPDRHFGEQRVEGVVVLLQPCCEPSRVQLSNLLHHSAHRLLRGGAPSCREHKTRPLNEQLRDEGETDRRPGVLDHARSAPATIPALPVWSLRARASVVASASERNAERSCRRAIPSGRRTTPATCFMRPSSGRVVVTSCTGISTISST